MKGIFSILFLTISFGLISCQNSPEVKEEKVVNDSNGWIELEGESYSFTYPATWELDTSGVNATQFVVLSQRVDTADNYTENINLVTEKVGEITLDEYVKLSESQISKFMNKGALLKSERKEGYHFLKFQAMNQGVMFIFDQFYFVKNGMAYILTFSAEESSYAQMSPLSSKIMESFKLK